MLKRTWPIGATKSATIGGVFRRGDAVAVVAMPDGESEAFVLMNDRDNEELKTGDRGTLRFVPGGPTGAHWTFERSETG